MARLELSVLPFPSVVGGERRPGSLVGWHTRCDRCSSRPCEGSSTTAEPQVCRWGVTYQRVEDDVLLAGVAVRDDPLPSDAQKRASREAGRDGVTRAQFRAVAASIRDYRRQLDQRAEDALLAELDEHRRTVDYTEEVIRRLGKDVQAALGQFHDYRALAGRVIRNMSAFLERSLPGKSIEEQLELGPHEVVAAYWAAQLMIDKFDTALFLLDPDSITAVANAPFRFHGLVTKYFKIYQREFEARSVRAVVTGTSFGKVAGNSKAISVIPHTFLDNAAKYAPVGSEVVVRFDEDADTIRLAVTSLGPKIADDERRRIFEPFFRGRAAKEAAAEGMGFGLAVCQLVANRVGTQVEVQQERSPETGKYFRTTFSVELNRSS